MLTLFIVNPKSGVLSLEVQVHFKKVSICAALAPMHCRPISIIVKPHFPMSKLGEKNVPSAIRLSSRSFSPSRHLLEMPLMCASTFHFLSTF